MNAGIERFRCEAERQRLQRLLAASPEDLAFLDHLGADELRALRQACKECLVLEQRPFLLRAIAASKMLPATLIASIGEHTLGPLLCARFSDQMSKPHLISICRHLSPAFMAEVGLHLDIEKLCELADTMPSSTIRAITREILERHEYIVLGEVINRLPARLLRHVTQEFPDGEAYLRTAFFVENPARLQDVLEVLPESLLHDAMRAAARDPETLLSPALSLTLAVSPAWQRRMMLVAMENGDSLLSDLVRGVVAHDLWSIMLPLVERLAPGELRRLMQLPAWHEPAVLDPLLASADRYFLRPWVERLLTEMPPALAATAQARLAARRQPPEQ